jgi:arylsulfatase A-like enzyme
MLQSGRIMLGVIFGAAFAMVSSVGAIRADQPPNILLIISDDQAWTDYGFMGHPVIETSCLDRLARESAVFTRGYVPTALCRPSLATMITGKYAHQHRISGNDPAIPTSLVDAHHRPMDSDEYRELRAKLISQIDQQTTLPQWLKQRGYVSFQSGKWWEGNFRRGGFDAGMTRGFPEPDGRHGDDGLKIGREGLQPIFDFVDQAVTDDRPFFVWYAPFLPHTPHNPPKRLFEKYKAKGIKSDHTARYYAMVEWFDETCGQLVEFLEDRQLKENTLIVYIGDNGWIQKPDAPGFAPKSKQSAHEGGTRQPTLFCWPQRIKPGLRDQQMCSSVDLVPTVLAAAEISAEIDLPGYNLLPILQSGQPSPRKQVFGETFAHDVADIDHPQTSLIYRWIIDGRMKLILTYDGVAGRHAEHFPRTDAVPQLYDLIDDPHETKNLATQHPDIVQRLREELDRWWPARERKVLGLE